MECFFGAHRFDSLLDYVLAGDEEGRIATHFKVVGAAPIFHTEGALRRHVGADIDL